VGAACYISVTLIVQEVFQARTALSAEGDILIVPQATLAGKLKSKKMQYVFFTISPSHSVDITPNWPKVRQKNITKCYVRKSEKPSNENHKKDRNILYNPAHMVIVKDYNFRQVVLSHMLLSFRLLGIYFVADCLGGIVIQDTRHML